MSFCVEALCVSLYPSAMFGIFVDLTADSDDDIEVVESVWGRHTYEGGVDDSSFPTESAQTAPRQQTTSRTSPGARTVTPVKKRTVKHRDRRRDWGSRDLLTSEASPSFVYIIENDAHNVYTGSTQDPSTRLQQHNSGGSTSRSTRSGRPWRLAATIGPFRNKTVASRFESLVKRGGPGVEAKIIAAARALKASPRSTNIIISRP